MDYIKVVSVWRVCATLVLLSLILTCLYTVLPQLLAPELPMTIPIPPSVNPKLAMTNPIPPSVNPKLNISTLIPATANTTRATVTSKGSVDDCINSSYVSFRPEGRLGNRVCEYIHLFHFHLRNSINARVHPEMKESLRSMFPHISLKTLSRKCLKKISHHEIVYKSIMANLTYNGTKQTMLIGTPCKPTIFWDARDHWRRELVFAADLQSNATSRKAILVQKWRQQQQAQEPSEPPTRVPPPDQAVVGVHVRRGDYQELLNRYSNGDMLSATYYRRAFQHYRHRFTRPVFLVLTEPAERDWCRQQLAEGTDDVIVVDDSSSAEQDLALLASSEHIIYSHGTFGLVGILLSDAKTVLYPAISAGKNRTRYALHQNLDILRKNYTSIEFVTVSSDEDE